MRYFLMLSALGMGFVPLARANEATKTYTPADQHGSVPIIVSPRESRGPVRETVKDVEMRKLFEDGSVIAKDSNELPTIRITSMVKSTDGKFLDVTGYNSADIRDEVRIPVPREGDYANFFGAIFVFQGQKFQRVGKDNIKSFELKRQLIPGIK